MVYISERIYFECELLPHAVRYAWFEEGLSDEVELGCILEY
jgi:hypothetical protein